MPLRARQICDKVNCLQGVAPRPYQPPHLSQGRLHSLKQALPFHRAIPFRLRLRLRLFSLVTFVIRNAILISQILPRFILPTRFLTRSIPCAHPHQRLSTQQPFSVCTVNTLNPNSRLVGLNDTLCLIITTIVAIVRRIVL